MIENLSPKSYDLLFWWGGERMLFLEFAHMAVIAHAKAYC